MSSSSISSESSSSEDPAPVAWIRAWREQVGDATFGTLGRKSYSEVGGHWQLTRPSNSSSSARDTYHVPTIGPGNNEHKSDKAATHKFRRSARLNHDKVEFEALTDSLRKKHKAAQSTSRESHAVHSTIAPSDAVSSRPGLPQIWEETPWWWASWWLPSDSREANQLVRYRPEHPIVIKYLESASKFYPEYRDLLPSTTAVIKEIYSNVRNHRRECSILDCVDREFERLINELVQFGRSLDEDDLYILRDSGKSNIADCCRFRSMPNVDEIREIISLIRKTRRLSEEPSYNLVMNEFAHYPVLRIAQTTSVYAKWAGLHAV